MYIAIQFNVIDRQGTLPGSDFNLEKSLSAIRKFLNELYQGKSVTGILVPLYDPDTNMIFLFGEWLQPAREFVFWYIVS